MYAVAGGIRITKLSLGGADTYPLLLTYLFQFLVKWYDVYDMAV